MQNIILSESANFEMFSLEHFITIGVLIAIVLVLFFTRKFFIKYKALDMTFRYVLATLIVTSEIILRSHPSTPIYAWNMPIPLCGHLLWIASIALVSNSERIYRRIYPLCLTGALLSLIVVDGIPHFPAFRAWQYFIVHGGFSIGALYFVFTRKINKFSFKDYGWSCLLLSVMGAIMAIFTMLGVRDDYMSIDPVPLLEDIRKSIGQLGYTFLYLLVIGSIMFIFTILTWLATRKRKDEDANIPQYPRIKFMDWISKHYVKTARWISVVVSVCVFAFMLVIQFKVGTGTEETYMAVPLAYIVMVINIIAFAIIIFNEILFNYELTNVNPNNINKKAE